MNRVTPYRAKASEQIKERIEQTINTTMYLVQTTGPTSYVIQEQDCDKKFKVLVGSLQSCSCGEEDICVHILFVMLKVFRVPSTTPIVWQKSLIDSEIEMLLRGDYREKARPAPRGSNAFLKRKEKTGTSASEADVDGSNAQQSVARHDLVDGEVCAICQEEMDNSQALTFCRKGCGNNFHIECMKVYGESRRQSKDSISCPLCRQDWGENALQELRHENEAANRLPHVHQATCCRKCKCKPIRNERYRCVQCKHFDLCARCFQTSTHQHRAFVMKKHVDDPWTPAFTPQQLIEKQNRLANAQLAELQSRELSTDDYDLLLQLDRMDSTSLEKFLLAIVQGEKIPAAQTKNYGALNAFCSICQQSLRLPVDLRTLSCGHTFHESCLERHVLAQKYGCPFMGCEVILFPGLASADNVLKKKHDAAAHATGSSTDPTTNSTSNAAKSMTTTAPDLLSASLCITSISQNAHAVAPALNAISISARSHRNRQQKLPSRRPPPLPSTSSSSCTADEPSIGLHAIRLTPLHETQRLVIDPRLNENQRHEQLEQQDNNIRVLPVLRRPTIRHGLTTTGARLPMEDASTPVSNNNNNNNNNNTRLPGILSTNESVEWSDQRIEQAAKFRCDKQTLDKERRRKDRLEREEKRRDNLQRQQQGEFPWNSTITTTSTPSGLPPLQEPSHKPTIHHHHSLTHKRIVKPSARAPMDLELSISSKASAPVE